MGIVPILNCDHFVGTGEFLPELEGETETCPWKVSNPEAMPRRSNVFGKDPMAYGSHIILKIENASECENKNQHST
jgi:hypothetical protein